MRKLEIIYASSNIFNSALDAKLLLFLIEAVYDNLTIVGASTEDVTVSNIC